MMKRAFSFNTLVMIYAVVVLVAIATWIAPGGEYKRETKDGRTLVIPGSFTYAPSDPQGIGAIFTAPVKGFMQAANIIVFVFIIGGAFSVVQKTGAIAVGVRRVAYTFANKPHLRKYFIPSTMLIFSIGGTVFGMSEETMPFVLIFIPLAISLGYDSLVGTAIPFLGAAAGFAGATLNPFTIGIAQGIAELPLYSGLEYRIIVWVISTLGMTTFVMWYGARIQKDASLSLVGDIDRQRKLDVHSGDGEETRFTVRQRVVLVVFALAIIGLIFGILQFKWFITEIAGLFLALGIVSGVLGGLKAEEITESFKAGARDMMGVAFIIGLARALLVIAADGKVMDTLLYGLAGIISGLHPILAAQVMFVAHGIINFFVHSGSGQAALTMPVMAPLADVVGVSRQTAVLAFQFGDGWINPILPTSGVTMGVLGLAGIPWEKWFKWMLPVQIFFFITALLLLIPPFLFHYH
jgi:uncharacterized ion transporter superfamily protein YfcC